MRTRIVRVIANFGLERYYLAMKEILDSTDLLEELERLHPGARAAVDFARVLRAPLARPRFDVGHYRAIERLMRIETERRAEGRRLVLAGDYRADPSWDGAVRSGRRAARAVITDLGSPARRAR